MVTISFPQKTEKTSLGLCLQGWSFDFVESSFFNKKKRFFLKKNLVLNSETATKRDSSAALSETLIRQVSVKKRKKDFCNFGYKRNSTLIRV